MSRGEYTARCAARDTRRAIEKVRKAMEALRDCARCWGDLDHIAEMDLACLAELPEDVGRLQDWLDEQYPKRPRRKRGVA
ncbi:hypothetical protein [Fulvimonas yonginensis]|uniref:Uncharacterized protein n=1 Tax=Fulvimonas yonginensis TaxID=1495200 RepID=A0ABU8JB91_9GAMM